MREREGGGGGKDGKRARLEVVEVKSKIVVNKGEQKNPLQIDNRHTKNRTSQDQKKQTRWCNGKEWKN